MSTPSSERSVFRVEVPLRWGDMDAQGHVNNGLIADYLQEARVDFMLTAGITDMLDSGVVVVSHQVEYLEPITFSSVPVVVELGITEIGASKFEVSYRLSHARPGTDESELCARATSVLCAFDLSTQRPRRLTAPEREWFERHRVEPEAFRDLAQSPLRGRGHRHDVRVRWSDIDRFHHVNNVRFFDYVQEARIAATMAADPTMARLGSDAVHANPADDQAPANDDQAMWLVVRQDVDYVGQLSYRVEPYAVFTAPISVGTSSCTFAAEITDPLDDSSKSTGGRVLGRARTVLVCADLTGRPQPLPPSTRARLLASVVSGD